MLKDLTPHIFRKALLVLLFSTTLTSVYAQEQTSRTTTNFAGAKSAFYLELFGNGISFSANYDTRLINTFGARIGIGYYGAIFGPGDILTIPVMGNFLLGKNGHYFELGAGITYIAGTGKIFDNEDNITLGTLSFMYRKQPVDGGFMWKIGFTPFLIASDIFFPYGGVGVGYCW